LGNVVTQQVRTRGDLGAVEDANLVANARIKSKTRHRIRDRRQGRSALVQRVSLDQGVTGRSIYPTQDCGVIPGSECSQDG